MIAVDGLYFAYGSNMSRRILLRRCPGAELVGPGTVEGWGLAFAGESRRWRGGVATIEPERGVRVPGIVWRLRRNDWQRLDRVEGVGRSYEKVTLRVDVAARSMMATAYVKPVGTYRSAPATRYVDTLEEALGFHALDRGALECALAAGRRRPVTPGRRRIFVYGTLRRGQANSGFLRHAGYFGVVRSAPRFTLVSLGTYPGLLEGGTSSVVGELYEVDEPTLARLDVLEGHPDYYRRTSIELSGGEVAEAYVFPASACRGAPRIRSADRCGTNPESFQSLG